MTVHGVMSRLRREGWAERSAQGSLLVIFTKAGRLVIVSRGTSDIPSGALRSICQAAGWEFPPHR